MNQLVIQGGTPLAGEVRVQGAKNSVLPILAATILAKGLVVLRRCPRLTDVEASIRILRSLGCKAAWEGDCLAVDTTEIRGHAIPDSLMREMRSSVIFLGAVLARCGSAVCSLPGGCELGPRPIDLHLAGLRTLGAEVNEHLGSLRCRSRRLAGRRVGFTFPSVGATENLMLAACGAEGETVITNAAREPEIVDLQNFLNACGGHVRGAGTGEITVQGGRPLHGCTYTIMPDRIAAATYLCAAVSAGGSVFLRGARAEDLGAVTSALKKCGCALRRDAAGIQCTSLGRPWSAGNIKTEPYPGFPTDAQAVLMAAVLRAWGSTRFEENLFENRFRHAEELQRLGADIRVSGKTAVVRGVERLRGASVECTDLRGGAALCVAALAADGETRIGELRHIDRGYENIVRDLRALGADVERRAALGRLSA